MKGHFKARWLTSTIKSIWDSKVNNQYDEAISVFMRAELLHDKRLVELQKIMGITDMIFIYNKQSFGNWNVSIFFAQTGDFEPERPWAHTQEPTNTGDEERPAWGKHTANSSVLRTDDPNWENTHVRSGQQSLEPTIPLGSSLTVLAHWCNLLCAADTVWQRRGDTCEASCDACQKRLRWN